MRFNEKLNAEGPKSWRKDQRSEGSQTKRQPSDERATRRAVVFSYQPADTLRRTQNVASPVALTDLLVLSINLSGEKFRHFSTMIKVIFNQHLVAIRCDATVRDSPRVATCCPLRNLSFGYLHFISFIRDEVSWSEVKERISAQNSSTCFIQMKGKNANREERREER